MYLSILIMQFYSLKRCRDERNWRLSAANQIMNLDLKSWRAKVFKKAFYVRLELGNGRVEKGTFLYYLKST